MKIEKVNDKVHYYIDELFYNVVAGAIELPTKIVMIDTGTNLRKIKLFKRKIEEQTGKKMEIVFNTHYHGDHMIGNQVFPNAKIIATELDSKRIVQAQKTWTPELIERHSKRIDDPLALEGLVVTPPTETFSGQMELLDKGVNVIAKQTGGHTDGSLYVYCPEYKVVFAGDNLFINSYPWGGEESCNPDDWIKTLKEYLNLDVDHIIPGHGPAVTKEQLKYTLNYFELLNKTIIDMNKEGKSEEEILENCFDIDFYPIHKQNEGSTDGKKTTLKKWFDFWVGENNKSEG